MTNLSVEPTISRMAKLLQFSLFVVACVTYSSQVEAKRLTTGIAITPKNFPNHSAADMAKAFDIATRLGHHSIYIFQWHEYNPQTLHYIVTESRKRKLVPVIGLSPTSLDKGRKELDIPKALRKKIKGSISFSNPKIRQAFINTAKQLARLNLPYLCLGTEINFLAIGNLNEFLHFVTLYKEAYAEVKKISPNTRVFVSFQWEWMRIVDSRAMHKIREHSKVINVFRPQLDLVALTTYPSPYHATPTQLPKDYYSWIYRHVPRNQEIMFMEAGWPTRGSGSQQEQTQFIKRLPHLLEHLNISLVAWSLLHDVNIGEFDLNLNTTGLIKSNGTKKTGFEAFKKIRKK